MDEVKSRVIDASVPITLHHPDWEKELGRGRLHQPVPSATNRHFSHELQTAGV